MANWSNAILSVNGPWVTESISALTVGGVDVNEMDMLMLVPSHAAPAMLMVVLNFSVVPVETEKLVPRVTS